MGQKVHPMGFRLGITKEWRARWFAERDYPALVAEDMDIRKAIAERYADANVTTVNIERGPHEVSVTMFTAKPGLVIGRGGQRVDESRTQLEAITGKRVRLNVQEVREPELDSNVVASSIASQLERRVAFRRAIKQAATRAMQRGAQGVKIVCGGRLGGSELARRAKERVGRMPLHTLRADVDYGFAEARTLQGRVGIKVWIYRGDILPEGASAERLKAAETPVSPRSPGLQVREPALSRTGEEASATTHES